MATNKPKVQGYLDQRNFDALEAYRLENNLSLSQALDIVVAGFFKLNQDTPDPKDIHAKKITELEESIESLNHLCKYSFKLAFERIDRLEQSDSLQITSDTPSSGDTPEITSDTPSSSDTPEITSDTPSSSDTPEITSDTPSSSDTPEITSDTPSSSDTPEITSDTPSSSDTPEITSDTPSSSDTPEITSDTPEDRLVICKLYKNNASDPGYWQFWAGFTEGFTGNLRLARKYKNEAAVNRQIKAIAESDHAATSRERISWRPYNELLLATAAH